MIKNFSGYFVGALLLAIAFFCNLPAHAAAARDPFSDVGRDSWAYGAISRLASRGIVSGYPDGLFRGRQTITRYEAAAMVARAAALFDSRRADKRDAEDLDRLVFEFRDEIRATGAQVSDIRNDRRQNYARQMWSLLGGWRLSGLLRADLDYGDAGDIFPGDSAANPEGESMGNLGLSDARLNLERWFGERDSSYFLAQFRADSGDDGTTDFRPHFLYAKIPFYFGSFITAGIAGESGLDARFGYEPPGAGSARGWFDDSPRQMLRLDVNYVVFNFTAYAARLNTDGWNLLMNLDLKLNQYLGLGLGTNYLDNDGGSSWDDIFTAWFGADYTIFDGLTAHGIVYYQRAEEQRGSAVGGSQFSYRLALELDQGVIGFSSLYAEYMRVPAGFFALEGIDNNMLLSGSEYDKTSFYGDAAGDDISLWKIGANQRWNDRLSTWLFFADADGDFSDSGSGVRQYGIGVEYIYSDSMTFGLNYLGWDVKGSGSDYSRTRLTTRITF